MKEHVKNVFRGQLLTSLIYLALGICLVMFPDESVNIICKVIFGIVLMLAGLYHIWTYMSEDSGSTIFNLFTGAILLVLGVFFFKNPQIVELILPSLLAALLLVDSIWTLKTGLRLKKHERNEWQFLVIVSLVFVTLGIVLFMNPFTNMNYTVLFAGWSFIGDAVLDFVSMILAVKGNKAIEKGEISVRKVLEVDIEANKISKEERKERKKGNGIVRQFGVCRHFVHDIGNVDRCLVGKGSMGTLLVVGPERNLGRHHLVFLPDIHPYPTGIS